MALSQARQHERGRIAGEPVRWSWRWWAYRQLTLNVSPVIGKVSVPLV